MRTARRWLQTRLGWVPGRRGYHGGVFEQHTQAEVIQYEVARELLGRRLGEALVNADAAATPAERARWERVADEAVVQRKALRVGSADAARLVNEAKAARAAAHAVASSAE